MGVSPDRLKKISYGVVKGAHAQRCFYVQFNASWNEISETKRNWSEFGLYRFLGADGFVVHDERYFRLASRSVGIV